MPAEFVSTAPELFVSVVTTMTAELPLLVMPVPSPRFMLGQAWYAMTLPLVSFSEVQRP